MKTIGTLSLTLLLGMALSASANDSVTEAIGNSKQWAIQTGDYANTRYSELAQITKDNVKDLKVAWTFSTGVLRGHEGSPLVIGDIMYVHAPFPNTVFALDLANDGKIEIDSMITHILKLEDINKGFDLMHEGKSIRAVVVY